MTIVPLFSLENYLMFLDHLKKENVKGKISRLRHDYWTRSIGTEVSFDTKEQTSCFILHPLIRNI
jgi:hypothetical protein